MPGRKPPEPLDEGALFDYAAASLGRRAQTVAELRRKMRRRVEAGEAGEQRMDAVVARLKEYGYLNDAAFAADYARLRQQNDKHGRRRVQQGLLEKGVHPELASRALDAAYENVDEEQLARAYIARKRIPPPADRKDAARLLRRLTAAGFSPATAFRLLRGWAEAEPPEPDGGELQTD